MVKKLPNTKSLPLKEGDKWDKEDKEDKGDKEEKPTTNYCTGEAFVRKYFVLNPGYPYKCFAPTNGT
jgi:hypothetical protein